jgi:hypothetical protein
MSQWIEITEALQAIENATDCLEGFELDEADQAEQLTIIRNAARKVRGLVHDILRPDKESSK